MNLNCDLKRFTKQLGNYLTGPATALVDFSLHARAQDYKRRLSGLMYPITGETITEKMPRTSEFVASRKMDGEFALLFFDGDKVISVNPGGTVRIGLPCFAELAELLRDAKIKSAVLAGELYCRTKERERVHDVIRIARNPKDLLQLSDLVIAVFDILELDTVGFTEARSVMSTLTTLLRGGKLASVVPHESAENVGQITAFYNKCVLVENAEGIVVRSDQAGWFKVKPSHTIDCAVIGFSAGINERKGVLHDLLVGLIRNDETIHVLGHIGGGFAEKERRELLLDLQDRVVPSNYTEVNSDHVAYEMVKPELVVEMRFIDILSEKSRGGDINRMVVGWNPESSRYTGIRKMPFVSVISPQFLRIRDDKRPVKADVSVKQISDLVEIPNIDVQIEKFELPRSEMIKREVYQKIQGDKRMIRKLLIWKTNKEDSGEFPPFVVYYTDFSSGRKEPLDRDIKPARTLEQADSVFMELWANAVKKGWEKVERDVIGSDF